MNVQAIVLSIAVAVSFGSGWVGNGWRLAEQASAIALEQSKGSFRALENAHAETIRIQEVTNEAVTKAQDQARSNALAARAAGFERDRLRDDLANNRAALAGATPSSVAAYAETLGNVFEQCTREYLEVAAAADAHALDTDTLFTAWKAIKDGR
jgi:hypothetical protein